MEVSHTFAVANLETFRQTRVGDQLNYPPVSKAIREVENLIERKNMQTPHICHGRFSFVFEALSCLALSYVLNPEGTYIQSQITCQIQQSISIHLFLIS